MKNHICNLHIRCDGKSKLKRHGMGSFKRSLIILKFSSLGYRKEVDLCSKQKLGENLAFENLQ
jgi:hypothetical protein